MRIERWKSNKPRMDDHQAEIDREVAELMDLDAAMQQYPPTLPSLTVISALLGFLYIY